MEPTIKIGSKFAKNAGEVIEIRNDGVVVSFGDTHTFITFGECELLFEV